MVAMMQLACPACGRTLEYSGDRPSFCAYCGRALASPPPDEAATVPPRADAEAATLAPHATTPDPAGNAEPETVGGYRLLRPLGEGGMGTVYEAEDATSGRRVAVKLILRDFATPDAVERFRQEGRLASQVVHPRCVFVFAADEEAGQPYIVMELMPGRTLQDLVEEKGPLPPEDAIRKILDAMEGLQEAHRLGLIHRDVKPSNCFLDADGRVKIGDFGLSKALATGAHLTKTGSFLGTPLYASPEQVRVQKLDAQTDVYSMAATLYFLLTGRAPHQTGDAAATLARIVADPVPPLRSVRPELPAALDRIVLRGLERDRKRRYKDLEEFRQALLPLLPVQPSLGDTGVRLIAFLLDTFFLAPAGYGTKMLAKRIVVKSVVGWNPTAAARVDFLNVLLLTSVSLLYFGLFEGLCGWTPGKWLLRLRVWRTTTSEPPGVLGALGRYALLALIASQVPLREELELLGNAAVPIVLLQLGVFVAWLVSMHRDAGYRGWHERLSGTRTVRLPWQWLRRPARRAVPTRPFELDLTRPEGLPQRLGPYRIRGALRWTATERTLVGEDESLGRTVWLWLRPAAEPPLDAARRAINRTTRIRWAGCGVSGDWQWDAFLAPAGCPLPVLVADGHGLGWPVARPILEDLTDELAASCAEGTLPQTLTVDQVWVDARGRVQLLGTPLQAGSAGVGGRPEPVPPAADDQERVLRFLREVAVLALEGRPRPVDRPEPIRAAIPLHAAGLVNCLLGLADRMTWLQRAARGNLSDWRRTTTPREPYARVEELQADLVKTQDRSREVTLARRAIHLAQTALLLSLAGGLPYWLVVVSLNLVWEVVQQGRSPLDRGPFSWGLAFVWPAMWVAWAFVFRGGHAFFRSSLILRRADGRPPSRLQCAWWAFVTWAPMTGLLGLAMWLGYLAPENPQLGFSVYFAAIILLVAQTVLALLFPARSLSDRLAGIYPVPR
jgi:hypothetical protein